MSELVATIVAVATGALMYWHAHALGQLSANKRHLEWLRESSERMDALAVELAKWSRESLEAAARWRERDGGG